MPCRSQGPLHWARVASALPSEYRRPHILGWLSRMGTPPSPSPCMPTGQGRSHSEIKPSPLHQLNAPGGGLACCWNCPWGTTRSTGLAVRTGGPGSRGSHWPPSPGRSPSLLPGQTRSSPLGLGTPKGRTVCLCSASYAWRSRPSKPGGVCRMVGWGGGSRGRRIRRQGPRRLQVFDSSPKPNQKSSSCAVRATEEKWSNGGFPCNAFSVFPKFGGSLSCL